MQNSGLWIDSGSWLRKMKTKELINLLNNIDPDGELEVCCGNRGIVCAGTQPSYYDGCIKIPILDEKGYIIGAKISSTGRKLQLYELDIEGKFYDDVDFPVEYDEYSKKHYFEKIEKWRQTAIEFEMELEREKKK